MDRAGYGVKPGSGKERNDRMKPFWFERRLMKKEDALRPAAQVIGQNLTTAVIARRE